MNRCALNRTALNAGVAHGVAHEANATGVARALAQAAGWRGLAPSAVAFAQAASAPCRTLIARGAMAQAQAHALAQVITSLQYERSHGWARAGGQARAWLAMMGSAHASACAQGDDDGIVLRDAHAAGAALAGATIFSACNRPGAARALGRAVKVALAGKAQSAQGDAVACALSQADGIAVRQARARESARAASMSAQAGRVRFGCCAGDARAMAGAVFGIVGADGAPPLSRTVYVTAEVRSVTV